MILQDHHKDNLALYTHPYPLMLSMNHSINDFYHNIYQWEVFLFNK